VVLALLLVAYFQRHNVHIPLPDLGGTGNGGLGPVPTLNPRLAPAQLIAYFS
jgi:hypothetical protein